MALHSVAEIERAIDGLKPEERAELYQWMEQHRTDQFSVIEQGRGMFGSPEDAALLDEVVKMIYEERRRPSGEIDSSESTARNRKYERLSRNPTDRRTVDHRQLA